jgi:hypothetical protein
VDFNDPRWFLLLVGAVLLVNRHTVVKITAVIFALLGVLWANGWIGPIVHNLLDGLFTPVN